MTRSDESIPSEGGLVSALRSQASSIPRSRRIFAPFIGSWDLEICWLDSDGASIRTEAGEWHFDWILEGRGVQDVWIVPPRGSRTPDNAYEYGTSVRFYDPAIDAWQSTWIGPMQGTVRTFIAVGDSSSIVLRSTPGSMPKVRWTFCDIEADTFTWTNEIQDDEGWHVQQRFVATRREPDLTNVLRRSKGVFVSDNRAGDRSPE